MSSLGPTEPGNSHIHHGDMRHSLSAHWHSSDCLGRFVHELGEHAGFKLQKTQFIYKGYIIIFFLNLSTKITARFQTVKSVKGGGKRQALPPKIET